MYKCTRVRTHLGTHLQSASYSRCRVSATFPAFWVSLVHFIFLFSVSVFHSVLHYSSIYSAAPHLSSAPCIPPSLFSLSSLSYDFSLRGIHLKPSFFIHCYSVMTTSPALTLSLNPLLWSNRKWNHTSTLSTQAAHLYCCYYCHCWCCCCGKQLKRGFSMMQYTLSVLINTRHTVRWHMSKECSNQYKHPPNEEKVWLLLYFNAIWEVWLQCFRSYLNLHKN